VILVHTTDKTWYIVLYQHTMYVIILSNIAIKTNFKQITRVELKLSNFNNTLREITFCAWRHVICCRSFINVSHYCSITFIVTVQSSDNAFLRNVDLPVAGNIKTMSLEMRIWPWIRDTHEWINIKQSLNVNVAYIDIFSPAFQWYDVMTK